MISKLLLFVSAFFLLKTVAFAQQEYPEIQRKVGKYFSGKNALRNSHVAYWLERGDPIAYQDFNRGHVLLKTSGYVAIAGGSLAIVGGAIAAVEGMGALLSLGAHEPSFTGPLLLIAGGAVALPGFSVMLAGKIKKNKAVNRYNETIRLRRENAYLYQHISPVGFAIGVKF